MKQKDINTGIIVPKTDRWAYYTDKDREDRKNFEESIVKFLELPENWKDYFKFDSSSDFITLQDTDHYKAEVFRRFKKGKTATIPADLKERLADQIKYKERNKKAATDKAGREANYKSLIGYMLEQNSPENEWHLSYYNENDGLHISLMEKTINWRDETEMKDVAKVYIKHTGEIKEPSFYCSFRYSASITETKNWLSKWQPYHDKIMAKAEEIKAQLPAEFFTIETVPA